MNIVVTDPPEPFVSLDEAKKRLRIYAGDQDDDLTAIIAAACDYIDGATGEIGRCVGEQTLTLKFDGFPPHRSPTAPFYSDRAPDRRLHLPFPPIKSVTSVTYIDALGASQTLTGTRLIGAGSANGAYVLPALHTDWPETQQCEPETVTVTYVGGYEVVPPGIKAAALMLVSHWNEHREAAIDTGAKFGLLEIPFGVQALLTKHTHRSPFNL